MSKIKDFYETDGLDYKYRRWEQYPSARFDYDKTYESIKRFIKKRQFMNVMEVGCGPGTWTSIIKEHSNKLTALDISETMIREAQKTIGVSDVKFINEDITNYQTKEKFDLVFSIRAFEYFPEKEKFINKCSDLLDKDGHLFIITKTKISYWYGRTKIRKLLRRIFPFLFNYENNTLSNEIVENISNFQQERYSTTALKNLLIANGFTNIEIKPVIIRPPLFMRGKTEIPIIPPTLDNAVLGLLQPIDKLLSKSSLFTIFAESYSISGIKK